MIIAVNRYYLSSGQIIEILINTDYILKVEPNDEKSPVIKTKVVYDSRYANEGPDIMYLVDTISGLKTKIGITRNRKKKRGNQRASK